jgi:ABC-type antimicrobial peptide transport system permease subunit
MPYRQGDTGGLTFYVRTASDTRPIVGAIPSVIARLDADLPIVNLRTMDDQIWENTTRERVLSTLSSSFATLATLLAAIGLYAVLSYSVAQRLREFGIRIAFGARSRDVGRLVLGQVTRISLIGAVIGAGLALALGRLGQALLVDVQGYDAAIITGATLLVLTIALAAGVLPARRATSVNPIEALRIE